MSSIIFRFDESQDRSLFEKALKFAIDEEDSSFVLDNGKTMSVDWFNTYESGISIEEVEMDPTDIEIAHNRLCDILINMFPDADFSSYALFWSRSTGYEKSFHIDYKDGKKSGFDADGIAGVCCPVCGESLVCCTDEKYEPGKLFRCSCGYEYDPLENPDCGGLEEYDSLQIDEIPDLKVITDINNYDHKKTLYSEIGKTETQAIQVEFTDKIFVTTGLSIEDEKWAREQIESRGGKVKKNFVVSLNYLIYNPEYDHETVKYTKTKEQIEKGKLVQILTFEEFKNSL